MQTAESFGSFASTNMINEATAFKTIKTGLYDLQINKVYEFNKEEGWARVGAAAVQEGQKRGSVFFRIQWTEARSSSGKLKTASKLFPQLLKALHPSGTADELSKISAEQLLDEAMKYAVSGFVTEFYQVPDTSNPPFTSVRAYPKTAEEVADVLKRGGVAKNDVISIYARK